MQRASSASSSTAWPAPTSFGSRPAPARVARTAQLTFRLEALAPSLAGEGSEPAACVSPPCASAGWRGRSTASELIAVNGGVARRVHEQHAPRRRRADTDGGRGRLAWGYRLGASIICCARQHIGALSRSTYNRGSASRSSGAARRGAARRGAVSVAFAGSPRRQAWGSSGVHHLERAVERRVRRDP